MGRCFRYCKFPFFDGDVPRQISYGVFISQIIRFARICSHVDDFYVQHQLFSSFSRFHGYQYHILRKSFAKYYYRLNELIVKFNVGLRKLLRDGLSDPDFYAALVYKVRTIMGRNDFSFQFRKDISRCKCIDYNLNVMCVFMLSS